MGIQPVGIEGISVVTDATNKETVRLIQDATSKAAPLIHDLWGLEYPRDCRIYIMKSWLGFTFRAAPWSWRIPLAITLPLWFSRAQRLWPYAGAWTQRFGRRVAIGIKPPSLLETSDRSIGKLMYVPDMDIATKMKMFAFHELTHAFSSHLRLPAWLNEGLAMATVDRCLGMQTIRKDTLELMRGNTFGGQPPSYAKQVRLQAEAIAYYAVLGYWIVRYLEEKSPGFLKRLFSGRPNIRRIDKDIALQLGIEPDGFWSRIAPMILAHYDDGSGTAMVGIHN